MSVYVADTHALVFYFNRQHAQLSRRALDAFARAKQQQAYVYVPASAVWEISSLEKTGRIKLSLPYQDWMDGILAQPCFECVPLDAEIIAEARSYGFNDDIFDAAIVATARLKDVPLITKDVAITQSGLVEIYW